MNGAGGPKTGLSLGLDEPRRIDGTFRFSFHLLTGVMIPCNSGFKVEGFVVLVSETWIFLGL